MTDTGFALFVGHLTRRHPPAWGVGLRMWEDAAELGDGYGNAYGAYYGAFGVAG